MRFKQFINEGPTFDLEQFKEDCQFYLEKMDGANEFLYHGSRTVPTDYSIMKFKQREGPTDSPQKLHDEANEIFLKKFDTPFRNGLFVTGSRHIASQYGATAAIFPRLGFKWLSAMGHEFQDLTGRYELNLDVVRHGDRELDYDESSDKAIEATMKDLENASFLFNKNLPYCAKSKNEIMLFCYDYYIFDVQGKTFREVIEPFIANQR